MKNGELIRRVFPGLTDATIAHLVENGLSCHVCHLEASCKNKVDNCYNVISSYLREEADVDGLS